MKPEQVPHLVQAMLDSVGFVKVAHGGKVDKSKRKKKNKEARKARRRNA
jgi:hypothetical protein